MEDCSINEKVIFDFYEEIGGDNVYCMMDGYFTVQLDGEYYGADGLVTNPEISHKITIYKCDVDKESRKDQVQKMIDCYFDHINTLHESYLEDLRCLINWEAIIPINDTSRVYMISIKGIERALRLFTPNEMTCNGNNAESVLETYRVLSDNGLTPKVYMSGMVLPSTYTGKLPFVFLVTDYIPKTVRAANKKEITEKAMDVCYKIQNLGYFGIDNHGDNFLVSEKEEVYAIDLGELSKIYKRGLEFKGKIRAMN